MLTPLLQKLLVRRDEVERQLHDSGWRLTFDGLLRRWEKGDDHVATPGGDPTDKSAEGWAAHLDRAAAAVATPAPPSSDAPPSQVCPVETLPPLGTDARPASIDYSPAFAARRDALAARLVKLGFLEQVPKSELVRIFARGNDVVSLPMGSSEHAEAWSANMMEFAQNECARMETTPVEAAAICLHCKQKPASKAEDDKGFTLCDTCYHTSEIDAPPASPVQMENMAREIDMLQAINSKLAGARSILERIVLEIGGRYEGELVVREALPLFSLDELYMLVAKQIERFERDSDDAKDARFILSWVGYHHEPGGLESALKGALADSRTPARWRHHRRAERARLLGQATLHEAAAHDHAAAGDGAKMARALQQASELQLQAQTQFSDLEEDN